MAHNATAIAVVWKLSSRNTTTTTTAAVSPSLFLLSSSLSNIQNILPPFCSTPNRDKRNIHPIHTERKEWHKKNESNAMAARKKKTNNSLVPLFIIIISYHQYHHCSVFSFASIFLCFVSVCVQHHIQSMLCVLPTVHV